MAMYILTRLNQKGITAEQRASAKAYMKGQYATRRLETIEQLASMLGTIEPVELDRPQHRRELFDGLEPARGVLPFHVSLGGRALFSRDAFLIEPRQNVHRHIDRLRSGLRFGVAGER